MRLFVRVVVGTIFVGALAASPAAAQSLWATNGAIGTTTQFHGVPGSCGNPTGPILGGFSYIATFAPCATAGTIATFAKGDITFERDTDTVWVTDGAILTNYTRGGTVLSSFAAPPMSGTSYSGLGWGSVGGVSVLWVTDGLMAGALVPPPAPGCAAPTFVIGPFALPGPSVGALDIDWDPWTATLWVSTGSGLLVNVTTTGAIGPGLFFQPIGCPALGALTGIAVDQARCGQLFVTNGGAISHILVGGAPAPPSFEFPFACSPYPGVATINGLGYDAGAISFGAACSTIGPPPTLTGANQATTPGASFEVTMADAFPGATSLLVIGPPACPPAMLGVCQVWTFPILLTIGTFAVPASGSITVSLPIPSGLPCGLPTVGLQFLVAKPGGGFQATNAVGVSVAQL